MKKCTLKPCLFDGAWNSIKTTPVEIANLRQLLLVVLFVQCINAATNFIETVTDLLLTKLIKQQIFS